MQKLPKERNAIGEGTSTTPESGNTWPFRIQLTTDHMRWDSLKIPHSKQLEEHILENIGEANQKLLEAWIPIDLSIHDVDTGETYKVKLVKKESFWFEPIPVFDKKVIRKKKFFSWSSSRTIMEEVPACNNVENTRKEFAYSIEPFKHIVKKRSLGHGQEIGFRWSGCEVNDILEFSVLSVPRLDVLSFRIYE